MKRFILAFILCMLSAFSGFSQEQKPASVATSNVKDLVEVQDYGGWFCVKARFVETIDYSKVLFSVEDEEYVIPVRLKKKDLGAENRFRSLNLHKGDTLTIQGRLAHININIEDYKGLIEASIIDVAYVPFVESDSLPAPQEEKNSSITILEQKPSFNGGDANEFAKWVNAHLNYPKKAKENGIQGRVTLQFMIKADGRVTDVKVLQGVSESLDKEAVRVVSRSPKWTPGRAQGKAVNVTYTFPVTFQLR